jgi:hypothetical protein
VLRIPCRCRHVPFSRVLLAVVFNMSGQFLYLTEMWVCTTGGPNPGVTEVGVRYDETA